MKHGWLKIEDNMNFLISRLHYNIGNTELALEYIENILKISRENITYDNYIVENYILYLNKLKNVSTKDLSLLLIPVFITNEIKVNLSGAKTFEFCDKETDIEMWKSFEDQLYLSNHKLLTSTMSYQKQLFTKFTENSASPIICLNDKVFISIEVYNPLGLEIILENSYLLWTFSNQNDQNQIVLCSDDQNSDLVVSDTIDRIVLQPAEKRQIDFFIQPKFEGQLKIIGIRYILHIPAFEDGTEINSKINGKQLLGIKGPRLNNNALAQRSNLYGIDNRLNIKVVPKMPLLHVEIENLPENMLGGELICANLNFINLSELPVKNLAVASNFADDLIFEDEINNDILSIDKNVFDNLRIEAKESDKKVSKLIHKFSKIIEPFETFKTKMWLQAPSDLKINLYKIHFMFYYENADLGNNQKKFV
jgi:hypothetical protein